MPIYQFFIMLVFSLFSVGLCISFYRKYKVNYLFIFETDPFKRMTQFEFYIMASFLLAIVLFFGLTELLIIKQYFNVFAHGSQSGFSMMPLLAFVAIVVCPFHLCQGDFRFDVLYSLFQSIIAPAGSVRFRDYMLADTLTSLIIPLLWLF